MYTLYLGTGDSDLGLVGITEGTWWPVSDLQPKTTYYWRVEACDTAGLCRKSPVWVFTTGDHWMYPLESGRFWVYERRLEYSNFHPEELGNLIDPFPVETLTVRSVSIETYEGGVVPDNSGIVALQQTSSLYDCTSVSFFQNRGDGLYYLGTDGAGCGSMAIPHKLIADVSGSHIGPDIALAGACPAGATGIQNPMSTEQHSLSYPLEVGSFWIVAGPDQLDAPWTIAKRVTSFTTIYSYALGYPECYQILRYWDKDGDGEWDSDIVMWDYIAQEGLALRVAFYYDIGVTEYYTDDPSIVGGTVDLTEYVHLIEFGFPED
jgi:hypothetical protein